jgi:uncharacterized protein YukE
MMGDHDTELEIGKQTEAAKLVIESIQPIEDLLKAMGTSIEGEQNSFVGDGAVALTEALIGWIEGAKDIGLALEGLAQRLAQVDETDAKVETLVNAQFARYLGRLGGPV